MMIKPVRIALCAVAFSALLGGCSLKQDMALQPKNRPLSPADLETSSATGHHPLRRVRLQDGVPDCRLAAVVVVVSPGLPRGSVVV